MPVAQGTVRQCEWIVYSHVLRIGYIFRVLDEAQRDKRIKTKK